MDLQLTGKLAVVTGASKGIGLAITRALAAEGASVIAGARDSTTELTELARRSDVRHVAVDLADASGPPTLIEAAREQGTVDVLVNNVGAVTPRLEGFLAVPDEAGSPRSTSPSSPPFAPLERRFLTCSPPGAARS
jgi:NAD(P)-dependent dehydrogenase (short-subunit alcohol dehydrogenase family)